MKRSLSNELERASKTLEALQKFEVCEAIRIRIAKVVRLKLKKLFSTFFDRSLRYVRPQKPYPFPSSRPLLV